MEGPRPWLEREGGPERGIDRVKIVTEYVTECVTKGCTGNY